MDFNLLLKDIHSEEEAWDVILKLVAEGTPYKAIDKFCYMIQDKGFKVKLLYSKNFEELVCHDTINGSTYYCQVMTSQDWYFQIGDEERVIENAWEISDDELEKAIDEWHEAVVSNFGSEKDLEIKDDSDKIEKILEAKRLFRSEDFDSLDQLGDHKWDKPELVGYDVSYWGSWKKEIYPFYLNIDGEWILIGYEVKFREWDSEHKLIREIIDYMA